MDYSDSAGYCVAWSGKEVYKDYSHYYPVVTFTKYADSLHDFIEKYPWVTIETSGYAYSEETFGDVGAGKFGTQKYRTSDFEHTDYFERFLVNVHGDTFWWTGAMSIGFGFKYDGNTLYLRPFIDGWLYSGGAIWRCLNYALNAPSITFHPEKSNIKNIILDPSEAKSEDIEIVLLT